MTHKWQTNSDLSGGLGGTRENVLGANSSTNLTAVPPDIFPGGSDYTFLDYQFITTSAAGSTTSAVPVALVVHAASAPQIVTDTAPLTNVTFVGGTVSFNASFTGTTPITNIWQGNTNSTFANIIGATNNTLTLSNIQLSAAGTYQFAATNLVGHSNSTPGTLIVVPGPSLVTNAFPHAITTNAGLIAYWRLNETNNPATSPFPVQAYDYSEHGNDPVYNANVTVGNPGPLPPATPGASGYIGFETNVTAAGTGNNAFLNVPALNLNTNTVTFIAWINPGQAQANSTSLFFWRPGNDAAGFGFNSSPNGSGMACLGYTWGYQLLGHLGF